jgi:hypothetical protein
MTTVRDALTRIGRIILNCAKLDRMVFQADVMVNGCCIRKVRKNPATLYL